ncbi:MAG: carboxypeptidase-like regulatory domain-containing protein, partial [Chitinophagaceae bacterium]
MRKLILCAILLVASSSLMMVTSQRVFAQEHKIAGRVTSANGSGLPGITIQIKGTSTGTATDAQGQYELSAPSGATLIFSGIGYDTRNVQVNGRATVNVSMLLSNTQLNELVVTAFGIKREARELGYSTA